MVNFRRIKTNFTPACLLFFCFLFLTFSIHSQDLPDKIRGYKVHKTNILVQNQNLEADAEKKDLGVAMDFAEPEIADIGLLGINLELNSKLTVFGQSGKIDFISFKDFKVNGIKVDIEEYKESFDFKQGEPFELKKPVRIFVGTRQTLRGALNEYEDSKEKWLVTGRVFVFGKFKKFGFSFKRVIPVDVELLIDNPLQEKSES